MVWSAVEWCGGEWGAVKCCGVLWSVVECCGVLWGAVEGMAQVSSVRWGCTAGHWPAPVYAPDPGVLYDATPEEQPASEVPSAPLPEAEHEPECESVWDYLWKSVRGAFGSPSPKASTVKTSVAAGPKDAAEAAPPSAPMAAPSEGTGESQGSDTPAPPPTTLQWIGRALRGLVVARTCGALSEEEYVKRMQAVEEVCAACGARGVLLLSLCVTLVPNLIRYKCSAAT